MNTKLYIIAGHNGKGTGANSKWLNEGSETIVLRDLIVKRIRQKNPNIPVVVDNEKTSLSGIVRWLRNIIKPNDISIDIHFNACGNSKVSGTECFIPTRHTELEYSLAKSIAGLTSSILNTPNRGVKTEEKSQYKKLAMLSGISGINVLWEVEFLSNEKAISQYLKKRTVLADAIADALINVWNSLNNIKN